MQCREESYRGVKGPVKFVTGQIALSPTLSMTEPLRNESAITSLPAEGLGRGRVCTAFKAMLRFSGMLYEHHKYSRRDVTVGGRVP